MARSDCRIYILYAYRHYRWRIFQTVDDYPLRDHLRTVPSTGLTSCLLSSFLPPGVHSTYTKTRRRPTSPTYKLVFRPLALTMFSHNQPLWMKQRREGEECSSQLALPLPRARLLRTCTRVRLLPFGNGGISAALSDGSYVGRGVRLPVRSHHHASDKYLLSVLRTTPEDSMIVDLCVGT